jgi:hypothetical protein
MSNTKPEQCDFCDLHHNPIINCYEYKDSLETRNMTLKEKQKMWWDSDPEFGWCNGCDKNKKVGDFEIWGGDYKCYLCHIKCDCFTWIEKWDDEFNNELDGDKTYKEMVGQ